MGDTSMGPGGHRLTDAPVVHRVTAAGLRPLRKRAAMSPMNTMDTELLAAVRGCYGAVRMRDLELTRTQRRHLASLVRTGELIAHEHGVVGIPGAERAVVLARIHGGLLTCQAAMRYYGLPVAQGDEQVHLVVTAGRRFSTVGREVLHAGRYRTRVSPTSYPVQPLPEALARFLRCHVQDDSRSLLLMQHFTMSALLPSRFGTCCAAPVRRGRSHDSNVPATGLVLRWRRWREWTLRLRA